MLILRRFAATLHRTLRQHQNQHQHQRTMATRSYRDAIDTLNSLQSNAATLEAMRAAGPARADFAIPEMIEFLARIGYTPEDLNRLNVLHVTGTKGKGSTCAFADSLLRHAVPSWKVGLYTSPHLVAVRERIRINGEPISEELFAQFFFDVWDKLDSTTALKEVETRNAKPMYFKFLTLVAYHAFLSLEVDATILEVGVGGMYDSTNVVPKPVVTGVTALGLDHTAVLGKTLAEIGWQKGGIYKEGVPAFTVDQPEEGLLALWKQAKERKASVFTVLPPIPEISNLKLGLHGAHQLQNATLAIHLAHQFLLARRPDSSNPSTTTTTTPSSPTPTPLSAAFIAGLENARWPGRCQTVVDPSRSHSRSRQDSAEGGGGGGGGATTWFLDGAHTIESLKASAEWYFSPGVGLEKEKASDKNKNSAENTSESAPPRPRRRVLVFNCTSGRSGIKFLDTLLSNGRSQIELFKVQSSDAISNSNDDGFFDHVIFCANVTYADGHFKGDLTAVALTESEKEALSVQHELARAWKELVPSFSTDNIHVLPSVEHALRVVRSLESPDVNVDVLVAGSLHLVGGVIEVAELGSVAL